MPQLGLVPTLKGWWPSFCQDWRAPRRTEVVDERVVSRIDQHRLEIRHSEYDAGQDGTATRQAKEEEFMANVLAVMASSPQDYERLGLSPTSIAAWEDGGGTSDSAGTYAGWY